MVLGRSSKKDEPAPQAVAPSPKGVDSLIAHGMSIDGDCETSGALRIEGRVAGSVRAHQLRVTRTGHVGGDVTGDNGGSSSDAVVIEGKVEGAVRAPRVEVGPDGRVGAGLRVKEAIVRGHVTGPVVAEKRLVLEETGVVEGDVTAAALAVTEGGQVSGVIRIGDTRGT